MISIMASLLSHLMYTSQVRSFCKQHGPCSQLMTMHECKEG